MEEITQEVNPPWGTLPVERYILGRWDFNSTLSLEDQRLELVRAYIQETDSNSVPSLIGFASGDQKELVETVLATWRPQKMRRIAEKHIQDSFSFPGRFIVLRTYYGGGQKDDEVIRQWMQQVEDEKDDDYETPFGPPDDRWWRVLDDPALFDMGSEDWTAVYNVLPELACTQPCPVLDKEELKEATEMVHKRIDDPIEDDYEDAIKEVAARPGQPYLLVVDEQALDEDVFLLVFRDKKGNVVKETDVTAEYVVHLPGHTSRQFCEETGFWTDAVDGKKYKLRGRIMRELLPIVSEGRFPRPRPQPSVTVAAAPEGS
jgi:hypothetical protein